MARLIVFVAAALMLPAPGALVGQTETFRLHADGVPSAVVSELNADLLRAQLRIERELDPFPDTVAVHVYPTRAAFTEALSQAWGMPGTECWMVGGADDHALYLLSPGAWSAEACEHDPADRGHLRRLLIHEALHAYHGQVNPSEDIGLLEDLGWFIEGVATYLSGQLDAEHPGDAGAALAEGLGPSRLADAWSGRYRYGVAGSMAAFIDGTWGRPTLRALFCATSEEELLGGLQVTEEEFLALWRDWVTTAEG